MDRLRCIEVFVEVARQRSFTAAARCLGLSRSSVSKHVAQLETAFGAQLLSRSTKAVNLTNAGRSLLDGGVQFVERFRTLEEDVRRSVGSAHGLLTIGTPPTFGEIHLVPLIEDFLAQNKGIRIKLHLDYGSADLIRDGLDLTLRVTPGLKDSSLIAQKLTSVPQMLLASPRYLRARGTPRTPQDLKDHSCLVHLLKSPNSVWSFSGPSGNESVSVSGPLQANFGEVLRQAALRGQGISMHPTYMVAQDLQEGHLKLVFPEFTPLGLDLYVLYPTRTNMPVRVRVFLDYLKQRFSAERD